MGREPFHQTRLAQSPIEPGLECVQGWGIHSFSGQPVPGPHRQASPRFSHRMVSVVGRMLTSHPVLLLAESRSRRAWCHGCGAGRPTWLPSSGTWWACHGAVQGQELRSCHGESYLTEKWPFLGFFMCLIKTELNNLGGFNSISTHFGLRWSISVITVYREILTFA